MEIAVNSEPAKPELQPSKNGNDVELVIALSSPLVRKASVDEIKAALRLVMAKLGIRALNLPSDEEKAVLLSHVVKNFGGNRVQEINLAFEMAIAGKLDLDDVNCYENFSCAYFSKVMISYQRWAAEAVKQIKPSEPPTQKIYTTGELEEFQREDVERQYQLFLGGFSLKGLEFNKLILVQDGLMKEDDLMGEFFYNKAKAGFKNIYVKK